MIEESVRHAAQSESDSDASENSPHHGARIVALGNLGAAMRRLANSVALTEVSISALEKVTEDAAGMAEILESCCRHFTTMASVDSTSTAVRMFNPAAGKGNPFSPPLDLESISMDRVRARCALGPLHEGPFGFVHGGVTALLLDQIVGIAARHSHQNAMTASLNVTYSRPIPLESTIELHGEVIRRSGRKVWVRAHIALEEVPTIELASAEALLIKPVSMPSVG